MLRARAASSRRCSPRSRASTAWSCSATRSSCARATVREVHRPRARRCCARSASGSAAAPSCSSPATTTTCSPPAGCARRERPLGLEQRCTPERASHVAAGAAPRCSRPRSVEVAYPGLWLGRRRLRDARPLPRPAHDGADARAPRGRGQRPRHARRPPPLGRRPLARRLRGGRRAALRVGARGRAARTPVRGRRSAGARSARGTRCAATGRARVRCAGARWRPRSRSPFARSTPPGSARCASEISMRELRRSGLRAMARGASSGCASTRAT